MTQNFLLVDLNEKKTKKLAETITSDTSRKILNHLANKDDSEQNISTSMKIPISTVHYHLLKLVEAELVVVEEFHYSEKGRVINHYKLANKYIIIAPKRNDLLMEKLKNLLPVALGIGAISAIIKFFSQVPYSSQKSFAMKTLPMADIGEKVASAPLLAATQIQYPQIDIALWFLIGGISALILYGLYQIIKEKLLKK